MASDSDALPHSGSLFDDEPPPGSGVQAARPSAALQQLASGLPDGLHMGTSSWHFPGWAGLVWDRIYSEKQLSRDGLAAYAQHPLFWAVSLDRAFYRPLSAAQYAGYARQVPETFRFVVKAPALVTDALVRESGGKGRTANAGFLDADLAQREFVAPASQGLGPKLGALVFQISPLPARWLGEIDRLIARLHGVLRAAAANTDAVVAVEVRNPEWLTPAFVAALKDSGATYCLGLHPKMPPIAAQLPILRALWPGPLVCRWNLNLKHGAFGYEKAREDYAPFDKLVDPDPDTRAALARVIAGTVGAGQPAYVTINNKAEGSSPESVRALAEAVAAVRRS
ncbi:DUF72 domain-containing protein [Salinisphaera hydrothermalis]|uniref:DUF72 domain-containing protein n=1 Tax=Salinisphaera hydrothermalis (strain C41B8) TaxID=1304275 RepID=A0A084IGM5_SALHC|nr:DUF72 domain-containing protein [Salinisphaera hydrothermalis]KEZ75859.1 hypothetical protein C41B8_17853 [Salinisphaera hydrothermalis C41B8]